MKFRKIKSALVAMLRSFALTPTLSYDFKVDNIYYSVISKSNLTCRVTSGNTKYSGNIKIPKQVTYNKRKFNVTEIAYSAFKGCSGLNSVIIPNSVTGIANDAFYGCSSLISVTIGNSVTKIGRSAFYGCSALEGVTSLATTAPSVYEDTFSIATYLNAMVYVPIGALESYSFATCWKNFNIEENVDYGVEGIKADGNLV